MHAVLVMVLLLLVDLDFIFSSTRRRSPSSVRLHVLLDVQMVG